MAPHDFEYFFVDADLIQDGIFAVVDNISSL